MIEESRPNLDWKLIGIVTAAVGISFQTMAWLGEKVFFTRQEAAIVSERLEKLGKLLDRVESNQKHKDEILSGLLERQAQMGKVVDRLWDRMDKKAR